MAFICIKNDEKIYSFIYSLKDWIALKEDKASSFNMACCGNQAILKTSKLGTQFFAHKAKPKDSDCSTGGETAEHMHIKYLVMKELDRNGWNVEVEKRGVTPSGEEWIADIVSSKQNCHKFQSATGMNFSQPLCIQHARKIYTSSAITFLN